MIIDMILILLQGVINILLLPLSAINIAIDFISSIPVVAQFIQIVAYVLPWGNIMPLIFLLLTIFSFRAVLSIINFIIKFVPFIG